MNKAQLWMDRFFGRRDVFGHVLTTIDPSKRKPLKRVSPVYKEPYWDKSLRRETEFTSVEELYVPLTLEQAEAHIKGSKEVMIYLPRRDGMTNFFAIDFDFQHGFCETKRVAEALSYHCIPHIIARSTTKGHHIYVFFDKPIEAYFITNFVNRIYTELDYMQWVRNDKVIGHKENGDPVLWTNPELFPKVITIGEDVKHTGNGIKPAMQGKSMEQGQCCFVDIDNNVIGGEGTSPKQWDYLKNATECNVEEFKKLIETLEIKVDSDLRLSEKRGAVSSIKSSLPYVPPEDGDFMRVIKGCPALMKVWEKPVKDTPHMANVALLSLALKCNNGEEIMRNRFGGSLKANEQIEWAKDNNQQPWTCKTIQDYDICIKGRDPHNSTGKSSDKNGLILSDHCFKKSPPREVINGKIKINPNNLPEEEWPWPSPIRLRLDFLDDIRIQLTQKIDDLPLDANDLEQKMIQILSEIYKVKNKRIKDELYQYLESKKIVNKRELTRLKKSITKNFKDQAVDELVNTSDIKESNGIYYRECGKGGYDIITFDKNDKKTSRKLCNFSMCFTKDQKLDSNKSSKRIFLGFMRFNNKKINFEISPDDYSTPMQFSSMIYNTLGPKVDFKRNDIPFIRTAITLFGVDNCAEHEYTSDYGYDCESNPTEYITRSHSISAEGVIKNSVLSLMFEEAQLESKLVVSCLSGSDKKMLRDIFSSLVSLQDPVVSLTGIGYSMNAVITPYIPITESPILWLEGLTGRGKSKFAFYLQNMHGDFIKTLSIQSTTSKSIELYQHLFRNTLLVIDDYKSTICSEKEIISSIQKSFDRTEKGRLGKDLKQSTSLRNRGSVVYTAEDPPTSDAATLSRLISVACEDAIENTEEALDKIQYLDKNRSILYRMTGSFISFMLKTYPSVKPCHTRFNDNFKSLLQGNERGQNSPRIVKNYTSNYTSLELFLEFLLSIDVIEMEEYEELRSLHFNNVKQLIKDTLVRCKKAQASEVFLHVLDQILQTNKAYIEGFSIENKGDKIGYIKNGEQDKFYLFPEIVFKLIRHYAGEDYKLPSKQSILKQLEASGHLFSKGKNSNTKKVRTDRNPAGEYIICLDSESSNLLHRKKSIEEKPKSSNNLLSFVDKL